MFISLCPNLPNKLVSPIFRETKKAANSTRWFSYRRRFYKHGKLETLNLLLYYPPKKMGPPSPPGKRFNTEKGSMWDQDHPAWAWHRWTMSGRVATSMKAATSIMARHWSSRNFWAPPTFGTRCPMDRGKPKRSPLWDTPLLNLQGSIMKNNIIV